MQQQNEKTTEVVVNEGKSEESILDKIVSGPQTLVPVDPDKVRKELGLVTPQEMQVVPDVDPELEAAAKKFAKMLMSVDSKKDFDGAENAKSAVENMGLNLQTEASSKSVMLKRQIRELASNADDGGPVAKGLIDLKMQVEDLDPAQLDLEPGWLSRIASYIPGVGTALGRYFAKYESAEDVLDAIVNSLRKGSDQLKRNNITLTEDQKRSRSITFKLNRAIKLGQRIDQLITEGLEQDVEILEEQRKFIQDELLFPLRQRIVDLQQTLAVHQEAVLAYEILVRNNKELIRGVNRVVNTTVIALEVAVIVAYALNDQRIVLAKIVAVNTLTDDMIAHTAERLKMQGVDIHKQASSAMLDIEKLKTAFSNINQAFDDISNFRRESLPMMAQNILEMDRLTTEAEKTIVKMEKGNAKRPTIEIEY